MHRTRDFSLAAFLIGTKTMVINTSTSKNFFPIATNEICLLVSSLIGKHTTDKPTSTSKYLFPIALIAIFHHPEIRGPNCVCFIGYVLYIYLQLFIYTKYHWVLETMFQNFKGNFFRFRASLGISTQIFRLNGVFAALSILIKHLHKFSQYFTFPTLIIISI